MPIIKLSPCLELATEEEHHPKEDLLGYALAQRLLGLSFQKGGIVACSPRLAKRDQHQALQAKDFLKRFPILL